MNYLYSLAGLGVGLLVGMTGVGGGSLMTPVLVLLFGFHPATAVGTDLLFASMTKSVGTGVHGFSGTVNWRVTGLLATGSIPATILTVLLVGRIGVASPAMAQIISLVLGIALVVTALAVILRNRIQALALKHFGEIAPQRQAALTIVTGIALGVLVSLSSVGAGALGLTVLVFLYPKQPIALLVGSDIAHAVPLTLLAGLGHWYLGSINFHLLDSLLIGSIPGIIIGSYLARFSNDRILKLCLGAILAVVGTKMLVK